MANLGIQADSIQQEWKEEKFIGRRSAESNSESGDKPGATKRAANNQNRNETQTLNKD